MQFVINPWDEYALTRAIELKEAAGSGTVTVLNVGEADTEPNIRKALAIGADDAIRVNAVPQDAYFVAEQIAAIAKEGAYDVIFDGQGEHRLQRFSGARHGGRNAGHPDGGPGHEAGYEWQHRHPGARD